MQMLGVRIDNVSMTETLEKIREFLSDGRQHHIVTPNPDFLLKAQKDEEFREILNKSDLSLPDGFGLICASWFLGERLKGRVVGVDLIEKLKTHVIATPPLASGGGSNPVDIGQARDRHAPSELAMTNTKIFLLGGFNGAAEKIALDWPAVVGFSEDADGPELFARIRECQPNILLVALGAPKQEKWIAQNLNKIPSVKVAIGVGSAFNIFSGQIKRAPRIFLALGLEWLWRLFREPRRWRKAWRSVVVFPLMVLKSKKEAPI